MFPVRVLTMASAVLTVPSEQVFDERVFDHHTGQGLEGVTEVTKIILDNRTTVRYDVLRQSGDCRHKIEREKNGLQLPAT